MNSTIKLNDNCIIWFNQSIGYHTMSSLYYCVLIGVIDELNGDKLLQNCFILHFLHKSMVYDMSQLPSMQECSYDSFK